MRILLRRLILGFLVLWLPLQSLAAFAMPVCQHAETQAQAGMVHASQQSPAHHERSHSQAPSGLLADNCFLSHNCSISAIPAVPAAIERNHVSRPEAIAVTHFTLFVPEQPQRPPLTILI